jgi:hypothetical protein
MPTPERRIPPKKRPHPAAHRPRGGMFAQNYHEIDNCFF